MPLDEAAVEQAALAWFQELGYQTASGADVSPGPDVVTPERSSYEDPLLELRLRGALNRLNPALPPQAIDDAIQKIVHPPHPTLDLNNHAVYGMLTGGVTIALPIQHHSRPFDIASVIDFNHPENNDFLAVRQFTILENRRERRMDIVVFVNGIPVAVFELKHPALQTDSLRAAWQQLQTYKAELPALFAYNQLLIVSNGTEARIGTISSPFERFAPWRDMEQGAGSRSTLETLIRGVFTPRNLLDLIRHFIVFESDGRTLTKKVAGYHQFHAVNAAVESVRKASALDGNRRGGVIWHTQGSGKSLTMAFFTGRLVRHPALNNPVVVVLTDRNDLDNQLYDTFSRCEELLGRTPTQAVSRAQLRNLLRTEGGRVIFTTVQKFFEANGEHPCLSERSNVIVLADEAHRSQYGFIDGFARKIREALPNATFVGFTGTPIETEDRDTRAVFGDYISIYDIKRAVEDGATVPIYYENRLVQLELPEQERPRLDQEIEELTETEEIEQRQRLIARWAQMERLVGAPNRLAQIARDLVEHFEARQQALPGKAMVVCMSRRICVALHNEIVKLRPEWQDEDDAKGRVKVIMTGSASDPPEWAKHTRDKAARDRLAQRFRNPDDPFQLAIVRDMWLTGFDAPCLHTIYIDKPMRGHTLMQAIARVNRVFRGKPGGLVVDYIGIARELKQAMVTYSISGGAGEPAINQDKAVEALIAQLEVCRDLFHGFDLSALENGTDTALLALIAAAADFIVSDQNRKQRYHRACTDLRTAFSLAVPRPEALAVRRQVQFFLAVRKAIVGHSTQSPASAPAELDAQVDQLLSQAIVSPGVVDVFALIGHEKPDISILSESFLEELRGLPLKNLAAEALERLLRGEIRTRLANNVVQMRAFSELLEEALRRYHNRMLSAAQVIEELIQIARDLQEASRRGEKLNLSEDELAFYDALAANGSAVSVLGDDKLRQIAHELVETVRNSVTIDWTQRESVRSSIRVKVKRILRNHGYPPDQQEAATDLVLEQTAALCDHWTSTETGKSSSAPRNSETSPR
jgi:type I restriction enzyme R subunit